jgi:type I restriction-modification system DNA methylase subunit
MKITIESRFHPANETIQELSKALPEEGSVLDHIELFFVLFFTYHSRILDLYKADRLNDTDRSEIHAIRVTPDSPLQYTPTAPDQISTMISGKILEINNQIRAKPEYGKFNSDERSEFLYRLIGLLNSFFTQITVARTLPEYLHEAQGSYIQFLEYFSSLASNWVTENYVPIELSHLIHKLLRIGEGASIYDPRCRMGSLFVTLAEEGSKYLGKMQYIYGNEPDKKLSLLCWITLAVFIPKDSRIETDSSIFNIGNNNLADIETFNYVLSFLPVTENWNISDVSTLVDDTLSHPDRLAFQTIPYILPPSKYSDTIYIQRVAHVLKKRSGKAALIVADGALTRGGSEVEIRRRLLAQNYVDAVIKLPAGMLRPFSATYSLLILDSDRGNKDYISFLDASNSGVPKRNRTFLPDDVIDKIIADCTGTAEHTDISIKKSVSKILEYEQTCDLNVHRYFDAFYYEKDEDLEVLKNEIEATDKDIAEISEMIDTHLSIIRDY